MAAYSELRIRFEKAPEGDGYVLHAAGPSGKADGAFTLPTSKLELENFALRLSRGRVVRGVDSPEVGLARRFGSDLFDALFAGNVRDLYRDSLSVARGEGKGLRLTLALTNVPELMHVPWEYLYDDPAFLSISTWTPVVRYLDLPRGRPPLAVTQPLRILGMISAPSDVVALDVGQEQRNLEQALAEAVARGAVQIDWLERATLRELQRAVRHTEYHVFHFVGHGGYDATLDDGVLLLEDDLGRSRRIGGAQLGTMLADETSLRLAVLNSCEGARSSSDDPYAGVATSLVRREVPAVVAMQFEITDRAALVFAGEFYSALADGLPVDAALAEARKAIFADENDVEWGTPVLYMRVPDGRIFDVSPAQNGAATAPKPVEPRPKPKPPPAEPPTPPPAARERRRLPRRRILIGAGALAAAIAGVIVAVVALSGGKKHAGGPTVSTGGGGRTTLSWIRRGTDPAVFGGAGRQKMTSVAALTEGDAVAVGIDGPPNRLAPAIWTYQGGIWRRQIKKALGRLQGRFNGVATSTQRQLVVVAVGTAGPVAVNDPRQDAMVWTFSDGSWRRTCKRACGNVAGGGTMGQTMYSVVHRKAGGFVAVGYDVVPDANKTPHFDAAVWTSPDGTDWSRVPTDRRVFGGAKDQVMRAVTETRSGLLVAAGWDVFHATVWTSRDGLKWTRTHIDDRAQFFASGRFKLSGIVDDGSRLVAVGLAPNPVTNRSEVVAWATAGDPTDGTSWRLLQIGSASQDRDQLLSGVSKTRAGTVAVGYDHGANQVAAAWLAPAGTTSAPALKALRSPAFAGEGNFEMTAVTGLADGRALAVGDGPSSTQPGNEDEQDAQFWTANVVKAQP
jgi:hypothetical protein